MIFVQNYRARFATNSSSSHSVILLDPKNITSVKSVSAYDDLSFGWDNFVLATESEKLDYLLAQFFTAFSQNPADLKAAVEQVIADAPEMAESGERVLETMVGERDEWIGVDHQSAISIPAYDPVLTSALVKLFRSPRVIVLGGNDNSEGNEHLRPAGSTELDISALSQQPMGVSRRHVWRNDNGLLTLMNFRTGEKVRLSLHADDLLPDPTSKATTPELVDVKITDFCTKGCKFCYQSSTPAGVHAPLSRIVQIADMVDEMRVFEVAIGGGEPTAHPEFGDILLAFSERGVRPNFTTYSSTWAEDAALAKIVTEHVGGIGVSCLSAKDLDLVADIDEHLKAVRRWHQVQITAQHVVGSVPLTTTIELIRAAAEREIHILLLGYKEVGFGAGYERFDHASTTETLLALTLGDVRGRISVSMDTAFVDQYPHLHKLLGAPEALVSSPEGKFSCYIDAVDSRMGASSYVAVETMDPLVLDTDKFKSIFAKY